MEPGKANTSRPASVALCAVIRAPERVAASTTSVASDSAAMMRLREGKWERWLGVPGGCSVAMQPWARMRANSAALLRG